MSVSVSVYAYTPGITLCVVVCIARRLLPVDSFNDCLTG